MISVRALGPLDVTVDGKPAPADLLWRHNIGLLLYIARAPAHRCTRDQAIGMLWPDKPEASARQSLRESVRLLRRYVGEERLRTEADQLELLPGGVELDTDALDTLIAQRDWAGATALVRGKFADGFGLDGSSAFEDWLHAERWHWNAREMDALMQHAQQRLDAGDLLGADDPIRRAESLDPESQRALRTRMQRLALAGDRTAALALHRQFEQRVRQDGIRVEPETQALVERLQRSREWKLPGLAHLQEESIAWRRVPLLGREQELRTILDHWRRARARTLGLALIEAVAGGGKTRLTEEVVARAALDGGVCIATRAVPADRAHELGGIVGLTRGGLIDAKGVAGASAAAVAAVVQVSDEWADRFPAAPRGGESGAKPLAAAVIEVLKVASAEQPLLLVIDDAQWLDDVSIGVLETMVRDLAKTPVLVLLAATPEPSTPRFAELRAAIGRVAPGSTVALPSFDHPTLVALVQWAFPAFTGEQTDRLARRIAADSAGVPLLAVEIAHAIAQGLDLGATSGAWPRPLETLDQTRPGDLPETIVAAIRVGFNTLTPQAAAALKAAAVLGERVTARRIGTGSGLSGPTLDAALDELEWRRWLVAEPRGYSFVARIVRDVVARDMVTEGEKQRILQT